MRTIKIFIEGSDATFKTTIVNKLSKTTGMETKRGSSFELATGTSEQLFSYSIALANMDNIVCDRFIWSNRVYATLYPEYTILSHEQRSHIEDLIRENSIVIHLTADSDTIINRIEERGDEYITTDKIPSILGMYKTVMSDAITNGITVITFDTSVLSSNEIVERILEMISPTETVYTNKCKNCNQHNKTKSSRCLGGDYCFSCYLKIMEDLLKSKGG